MSQRLPSHVTQRANKSVDENIADSVDETVGEMLGDTVIEALYAHLYEKRISRKNLLEKVDVFCKALDETFGVDSKAIQRNIAKRLFLKLDLDFVPDKDRGLIEYVKDARQEIANLEA